MNPHDKPPEEGRCEECFIAEYDCAKDGRPCTNWRTVSLSPKPPEQEAKCERCLGTGEVQYRCADGCCLTRGEKGPPCDCSPKSGEVPMGVSQWAKHGKRFGYWSYYQEGSRIKTDEHMEAAINLFIRDVTKVNAVNGGFLVKSSTRKRLEEMLAQVERQAYLKGHQDHQLLAEASAEHVVGYILAKEQEHGVDISRTFKADDIRKDIERQAIERACDDCGCEKCLLKLKH